MSPGITIIISIIGFSILLLIVVGVLSYRQMKPTLKNLNQLEATFEQKKQFYKRESQYLNDEIEKLTIDANALKENIDIKSINFQYFSRKQNEFQNSLLYLKNHSGEYSKGIAQNVKREIKEDGPKVLDIFKRAFKKTIRKQKTRYTNK